MLNSIQNQTDQTKISFKPKKKKKKHKKKKQLLAVISEIHLHIIFAIRNSGNPTKFL